MEKEGGKKAANAWRYAPELTPSSLAGDMVSQREDKEPLTLQGLCRERCQPRALALVTGLDTAWAGSILGPILEQVNTGPAAVFKGQTHLPSREL